MLGRYRLEAHLGRGSMAEVFRAYDPDLDRAVAIKTVRLDTGQFAGNTDELIARFQQEARSAGSLSHPNIVTVYDYGQERGLYYLVMEYVEGDTLARRLAGGALPAGEAAVIVQQACEALGAAHEAGIVHRDIKPGNLMVDRSTGLVKVMDFGIAKLGVGDLTRDGGLVGTPRYMSPEQVRGEPVDGRSDLFSLGTVYCEILTGELAFTGDNMSAISYQIVNEDPAQLAEVESRFGEGPAWVLRRALAKEPEKRFQTAAEFRSAIDTHCLGTGVTPPEAAADVARAPDPLVAPPAPVAPEPVDTPPVPPIPVPTPPTAPAPPAAPAPATGSAGASPSAADPSQPVPAAPVFSSPRRVKGPGRGLVLGSLFVVLFLGGGFAAWLRFGAEWGLRGTGDENLVLAADSSEVPDSPPPDTAPPPEPPPVRLALSVEPVAAAVTVDDTLAVSPDSGALLAVGSHRVRAEAAGYLTLDTLIELAADDSLRLTLARAPPTTGTVAVSANLPGRVLLNGRDRGAAPLSGLRLRPGSYTVRFVPEAGDGLAEQRTVIVRAGEAARISFDISDALLSVGVREPRWATVYAGEARLGDTPLIEHRMPARVYTVRVAREGYVTQERLVRLTPGESYQWVDVVLDPVGSP